MGRNSTGTALKLASEASTQLVEVPGSTRRSYADFEDVIPRHVKACRYSEFKEERWFVWFWKKAEPGKKTRVPYSCNSWRCPVCARHEAAVTFARIRDACADLPAEDFVFIVLTLDRDGFYTTDGKSRWVDAQQAYRELGAMSRKFLKRLRRWQEVQGWEDTANRWVGVVEAHRSGWPHMNLLVYAPELAQELRERKQVNAFIGKTARESILLEAMLKKHAVQSGWGPQSTAEAARSKEALAAYVTKLAAQQNATAGELAKITQKPMNAPQRFRRLRSGKGFLPPRKKSKDTTGCLVVRESTDEGFKIRPLNCAKDLDQLELLKILKDEKRVADAEVRRDEENRSRRSLGLVEIPKFPTTLLFVETGSVDPTRFKEPGGAICSDETERRRRLARAERDGLRGLDSFGMRRRRGRMDLDLRSMAEGTFHGFDDWLIEADLVEWSERMERSRVIRVDFRARGSPSGQSP